MSQLNNKEPRFSSSVLAAHDIPKSPKSCSSYSHNHPEGHSPVSLGAQAESPPRRRQSYKIQIQNTEHYYKVQNTRKACIHFFNPDKKGFRMMTRFFIFDTAADKAFHIPPLIKECWPTYHPFTNQPAFQVLYKYCCRHQQRQH